MLNTFFIFSFQEKRNNKPKQKVFHEELDWVLEFSRFITLTNVKLRAKFSKLNVCRFMSRSRIFQPHKGTYFVSFSKYYYHKSNNKWNRNQRPQNDNDSRVAQKVKCLWVSITRAKVLVAKLEYTYVFPDSSVIGIPL